ncbi:MAG TPA: hypothetical protein VIT18_08310 [Terrimicrobiaceae bacterium]
MPCNKSGDDDIRKAIIEADLAVFYSTQIPVFLWFLGKNEHAGKCRANRPEGLSLAA